MTSQFGRRMEIAGWGHALRTEAEVVRPELVTRLRESLLSGNGIARGLGRAYGDAALATDRVWQTTRLNRMLRLGADGLLTAEAGVSLGEIIRLALPQGWTLPVTPGTQWVTLGGAIAADVHGKNHHEVGTFGQHVTEIILCTADGDLHRIGPDQEPDLFWATVGGMGLTGVIVEASLRLVAAETGYLTVDYERTQGLEETLEWFSGNDAAYPFTVAWIDGLSTGRSLGRAVLMGGRITERRELQQGTEVYPMPRGAIGVPFEFPSGTLSRSVGLAFNAVYYGMHRPERQKREAWWKFFYPLDVADDWYKLYGRRGFAQYQAVYPPEVGARELRALLERIHKARHPNFLGVLKRMGEGSPGLLSFPRAGLTLALDLPMQGERSVELFRDLYAMTADLGGRVYLAKDAFLTQELFRRMYPQWQAFVHLKTRLDPHDRFRSQLSERVGLSGVR
ncbi:MAG: FAD-binding oxidoreductase [Thermaerobacter sp.]|nr:FAD-binding oxidoreductase [Thermaerobacter sp.]